MSQQNEDQSNHSFLFTITPLQIISSSKSVKNNKKKSILIKLGTKTQKTNQLNKPIKIQIDVLYSKSLKKYCPIKGIIKIYDINNDGNEVISSVGGFQTEQLLNQRKTNIVLQKDIGSSKLKMRLQIQYLGECKKNNKKQVTEVVASKSQIRQPTFIKQQETDKKPYTSYSPYQRNVRQSKVPSIQIKKQALIQQSASKLVNQIENSPSANEKQLNEKQSKSTILTQKDTYLKNSSKLSNKKTNENEQSSDIQFTKYCKAILDELEFDKFGKIIVRNNESQKLLSIKYKTPNFQNTFRQFIEVIKEFNKKKRPLSSSSYLQIQRKNKTNQVQLQKKIQSLEDELNRKNKQISQLKAKQKEISTLQIKKSDIQSGKVRQNDNKIKDLQNKIKKLQGQNKQLRQKQSQMELIIFNKQNSIQTLKQQIDQNNIVYKEMEQTLNNDELVIQELKQEVSNLSQTIQHYREKYGDLKSVKNKALQNELKQCLMWIDQQTRQLEDNSDLLAEENTQASHSHNVSDIIKNLEIQGASRQEMSSIKLQLAGLITRIDNFLNK